MKILVDIVHMADVNFYKKALQILDNKGHEIIISVMGRGNLPEVVAKELGNAIIIGAHSKKNFLVKSMVNIKRITILRRLIKKTKPDLVTSFSYYPAAAAIGLNVKSVIFHDDAEYKKQFLLCRKFAGSLVIPDFIRENGRNIIKHHFYKEWAYLNPKYFKANEKVLKYYGLEKNKYVIIRDIAKISLNYKKSNDINYAKIIDSIKNKGLKIVVSLEDKSRKDMFKGGILLKEPVQDIYSIVYYSLALISSGDTMAREAALLGVPSFYASQRKMAVNKELISKGFISPLNDEISLGKFVRVLSRKQKNKLSRKLKNYVSSIEDTTKIIVDEIEKWK